MTCAAILAFSKFTPLVLSPISAEQKIVGASCIISGIKTILEGVLAQPIEIPVNKISGALMLWQMLSVFWMARTTSSFDKSPRYSSQELVAILVVWIS